MFMSLFGDAGRNGKSSLIALLEKVFGGYILDVAVPCLCCADKEANKPNPNLYELMGKRLAICSEIAPEDKLNTP